MDSRTVSLIDAKHARSEFSRVELNAVGCDCARVSHNSLVGEELSLARVHLRLEFLRDCGRSNSRALHDLGNCAVALHSI